MVHPTEQYKNIQGWIPETDIDGIDAKKDYLAKTKNADLENGYLTGCVAPSDQQLHPQVSLKLSEGYDLIEVKHFYHSIRKNIFFHVLWKDGEGLEFIVYELDYDRIQGLNIDYQNSNVIFSTKPTKISWSLTDDQLKINLNVTANYVDLAKEPIFNLTLIYFSEERTYGSGIVHPADTWYLFPRWLGWSYDSVSIGNESNDNLVEDLEDETYITGFDFSVSGFQAWTRTDVLFHLGLTWLDGFYLYGSNDDLISEKLYAFEIDGLRRLKKLSFVFGYIPEVGEVGQIRPRVSFYVQKTGDPPVLVSEQEVPDQDFFHTENNKIECEYNLFEEDVFTVSVVIAIPRRYDSSSITSEFGIDNITLEAYDDTVVLGKNFDGQRALLSFNNQIGFYNELSLVINVKDIDWRISAYEVYRKTEILYFILTSIPIGNGWNLITGNIQLEHGFVNWTDEEIEQGKDLVTLNFNYGLGSTVRVDNQKNIYDEVFYKARTYFIKDDYRVYQSHISGTGRIQPDSFPYNEDVEFGFFITGRDDINLALAVTNLEELLIIGRERDYNYYIEGGQGIVYRILKKNDGGKSIVSKKSLVKSLSGSPDADVLFWIDSSGAYIYGGGKNPPKDVVIVTHRNYWKTLDKENVIAFYNKAKTEFWMIFNQEIIIYELSFNKFKRYEFSFTIRSYVGKIDNVLWFLTTENELKTWNPFNTSQLSFEIEVHYSANTVVVKEYPIEAPEHETKILQELYVAVKDKIAGLIKYVIIFDGNEYPEIIFTTDEFTDILPAPLLIRYGKVKLRLIVPPKVNLREFGYSFSVPGQAPCQQVKLPIFGIGMSSGKETGVYL